MLVVNKYIYAYLTENHAISSHKLLLFGSILYIL